LGYAYLVKHDYPRAAEYFTKALKHDPDDPRLLYYSALLIQSERGPGLSGDRKQLGVAQKQLEKSVALDPEYADASRLLALTYASLGKKDEALRTMRKAVDLNPRNEQYLFNLAQMYMVNGKYDESIARLQPLTEGRDPEIRARAEKELLLVRAIKRASLAGVPVEARAGTLDAVSFLMGKLDAVDCSASPEAIVTIISEGRTWKLHARDSALVIVMGADKFSCDWTNQKVAVNYRKTGEGAGELVSVEVQ
jgi:predicted Zn-dependent protease